MGDESDGNTIVRQVDRVAMAKASPLPPPEEVFVDWLISVPHDACLEEAARQQIALIDRRRLFHADVQCLRTLLVAVAGVTHWSRRVPNL